jgi:hypothetical protein
MPDQRSLLLGRLASAIDGVADVASHLVPAATEAKAPTPPPPPAESLGRPWTLAAAMEPITPSTVEHAGSPGATLASRNPEPLPPPEHHRSGTALRIIGSTFLIILVAAIGIHLLGAGAAHPGAAHPAERISLTGVRPVASAPRAGGALPVTQLSFPASTSVVDIEVNSGGAAGQAPVHIVVTVGQPAQTIIQHDYVLSQSGATVVPLTPPGGTFAPGNYEVTITFKGVTLGSTAFAVQ